MRTGTVDNRQSGLGREPQAECKMYRSPPIISVLAFLIALNIPLALTPVRRRVHCCRTPMDSFRLQKK